MEIHLPLHVLPNRQRVDVKSAKGDVLVLVIVGVSDLCKFKKGAKGKGEGRFVDRSNGGADGTSVPFGGEFYDGEFVVETEGGKGVEAGVGRLALVDSRLSRPS